MRDWTVGKRLIAGFTAILVLVFALGVFAVWQLREIGADATVVADEHLPDVERSARLEGLVRETYGLTLQVLTATNASNRQTAEERIAAATKKVGELLAAYEASITVDEERTLFAEVVAARQKYVDVRARVLASDKAGKKEDALSAFWADLGPASDAYLAKAEALTNWNSASGHEMGEHVTTTVSWVSTVVIIGVVIAVLLSAGIGLLLVRSINGLLTGAVEELSQGSSEVVSASTQVARSAQSLSQGATEQAASLEETSASMEEMSSMTRRNAENAQQAAALVAETESQVQGANGALNELVQSMSAIRESSGKVTRIIKTIDEIAFQTNILALNAAVEAARAGEAGMGFAVVADEVRNLAQRSAQAAKDTAALIEESAASAQSGSSKVDAVAQAMTTITESAARVRGLVDQVNTASEQQTQGISQVTQAVSQMEKVTQTTAATAEESAAAAEELSAQAEHSMGVVRRLQTLIGASGAAPSSRRAEPAPAAPKAPGKVVKMARPRAVPPSKSSAEEQIPLETGTFGSF